MYQILIYVVFDVIFIKLYQCAATVRLFTNQIHMYTCIHYTRISENAKHVRKCIYTYAEFGNNIDVDMSYGCMPVENLSAGD